MHYKNSNQCWDGKIEQIHFESWNNVIDVFHIYKDLFKEYGKKSYLIIRAYCIWI